MDNRYFTILGHATGRLLLKRPGYELDFDRVIEHAKERNCFFELNSSPDRLDVSAENARLVRTAGIGIAISTDSHSTTVEGLVETICSLTRSPFSREDRRIRKILVGLEMAITGKFGASFNCNF
jgi:histidinol phosphatase-like PHP family hydrolase